MTYDGYVAFATEQGVAGTIPRRPARMTNANVRTISFNGARCRNAAVPTERLEEVSNSVAADEDGGIYVVTSKRMRRIDHHARRNRLTSTWSARYEPGSGQSAIRLGLGSGSTPTVMGVGRQDRFVVITDGRDLMHVNLFWRDRIPRDWRGLGEGRPRRMACDYPVRFGDPRARFSLSEQSVNVRGYATFHVNNLLDYDFTGIPDGPLLNSLAALRGGDPQAAPYGGERIDWNPRRRRCVSRWANPLVSIPDAIPSMSAAAGLAYGSGPARRPVGRTRAQLADRPLGVLCAGRARTPAQRRSWESSTGSAFGRCSIRSSPTRLRAARTRTTQQPRWARAARSRRGRSSG